MEKGRFAWDLVKQTAAKRMLNWKIEKSEMQKEGDRFDEWWGCRQQEKRKREKGRENRWWWGCCKAKDNEKSIFRSITSDAN